ncbi:CTP synthase C-terminal region-related (seleno)protein [Pantoea vagans]|uniref:CTP synthase C-terminal region-related (seleno)protein n=1 Tax=Pantoea vagans TaxID=470934 RepID=UPI0023B09FE1|nr:CTP synthase [Pantoea vagans]MDE8555097.1 CTP synthase [Pantoea vagans]MDE8575147.1 CTP synthase [Pantoea vagans]
MSSPLQLSLAGDYRADAVAHQAIPLAIERAARWLNITVEAQWIASEKLAESDLRRSDAVWVVPGSPYHNDEAIFDTIRWARESGKPFLGSCGGFQYAVIEYARNVLGWHDASHAETDAGGRRVIAPLSCSLVEQRGAVRFEPGSRIAAAYGTLDSDEGYHCNFGVNPEFSAALGDNTLRITAWDDAGDVRGVELPDHPFFVATLFQSERAALQEKESQLVVAWMQAALAQR